MDIKDVIIGVVLAVAGYMAWPKVKKVFEELIG